MLFSLFARQIFVAVAPQLGAMSLGGAIGFPCILLQQFKSNESTIRPDLETMTWITSMDGIAGLGAILVPPVMQAKGRKFTFICSCLLMVIGWLLAFAAKDAYIILLAEAFLGFGCNCTAVVNLVTVSEMLPPKYRTASMMFLGISQSLGFIGVTTIGTFIHWKTLALIMCSPGVIALIMIFFWPESPLWLIFKGKVDQFEKAFTWLRGTDEAANNELQALIIAYRKKETQTQIHKPLQQEILAKFTSKDFYMPSLHMILILTNFYIIGGVSLLVYSKDVMEIATGNEKAAKFWFLMINTTFLFGSIISLVLIKRVNSKTIFYIGAVCNIFLLAMTLISYLRHLNLIAKDSLFFCYFLYGYFICIHSGLNTVTFTVAIELMPVKHRGLGGILYTVMTSVLFFSTVKLLPYMILCMNVWGTLLLYSVGGSICTLLIMKYVPETKGRTLQEIEEFYNFGFFVTKQDFHNSEDVSVLVDKRLK